MDDNESPHRPSGNTHAIRHTATQQHTVAPQQSQQNLAHTTPGQIALGNGRQVQQTQPQGWSTETGSARSQLLLEQEIELQQQQLELRQQHIANLKQENEALQQKNEALQQRANAQARENAVLEQQLALLRQNARSSTARLQPPRRDASQPDERSLMSRSKRPRLSTAQSLSAAGPVSSSRQDSHSSDTQTPRPLPASNDSEHEPVDRKPERVSQTTAPAVEDDVIPAIDDNGYAHVNIPMFDEYRSNDRLPDNSSAEARHENRVDGTLLYGNHNALSFEGGVDNDAEISFQQTVQQRNQTNDVSQGSPSHQRINVPAANSGPTSRFRGNSTARLNQVRPERTGGKKKEIRTLSPFARFIFVPNNATGGDYEPLTALPRPLFERFSTWLDMLLTDEKYSDRACRKLAVENRKEVIESGVCIARHIMWKCSIAHTTHIEVACKTCCDATEPRPCVRLVEDETETPILVFFPRPADRRPSDATWKHAQFWLGVQGRT